MANFVTPQVFYIAKTELVDKQVLAWLKSIHGEECLAHVTGTDIEQLTELAGRRCYKSFVPGLNPNVTKVRTDSAEYLDNVLKSKHGSVAEHSSITFAIENVSRVVTHELVRHRVGAAYSQESLRFVRLTDLNMYFPSIFSQFGAEKETAAKQLCLRTLKHLEEVQKELMDIFAEEMAGNFDVKKKLTSAFRRLAPIGLATGIIATFNIRADRHIIAQRTSRHAEEEIRLVGNQMMDILNTLCPALFADFSREMVDGLWEYVPKYEKV